jgi:hypothetical protein
VSGGPCRTCQSEGSRSPTSGGRVCRVSTEEQAREGLSWRPRLTASGPTALLKAAPFRYRRGGRPERKSLDRPELQGLLAGCALAGLGLWCLPT